MGRTNIEIDDELIERAMARYGFRTKRETVDYALRRLVRRPLTSDEFDALEGSGWGGDLDEFRAADDVARSWSSSTRPSRAQ